MIAYLFPPALFLFPFLALFTQCTPLQQSTQNELTTPPPQERAQPETPSLSPEEQLERFNRFLDQA